MSLFTKLFEAVHSWRRRRGGSKPRKRSDLAMEQLDHRQLLTVNFTGNVPIDFPAIQSPGVVTVSAGKANQVPLIPPTLASVINVSGLQIDDLRVSYDSVNDVLSVGAEGPANNTGLTTPVAGKNGQQVIAADSDNNLNSGTVDPRISNGAGGGIDPSFTDPANFGGTKTYGVFLSLNGSGTPQVVAGFPQAAPAGLTYKPFEVAKAIPNPISPTAVPSFDNTSVFPQYTGNYLSLNDPNHPNFEFNINHFSLLYQQFSGHALTPTSNFGIGAFASNNQDIGLSDEFFPTQTISLPQATAPVVTPPVPPIPPIPTASPTILVNFHQRNHVNSAHPTAVRVNVLGSAGFDPTTIIPSTVRFGDPATIGTTGAPSILNFENNVNHDEFPDETFVFNGLNVNLPPGTTTAEITGETTSGVFFNSQVKVFNRDSTYYAPSQVSQQEAAWLKYDKAHGIDTSNGAVPPPVFIPRVAQQRAASAAINDLYGPFAGKVLPKQVASNLGTAKDPSMTPAPVVSIPTKHGKTTKAKAKGVTLSSVNMGTQAASTPSMSLFGGA